MSIAFLFPGQGSQYVGMGQDLYEKVPSAKELYDLADRILPFKLTEICFNGPEQKLNATDIQQPAVFVMSAAALQAMRSSDKYTAITPSYMAGLSLGEYTAYYAAGSFDFESALRLVEARSRLMQEAAKAVDSTMVAVMGLEDQKVIDLCEQAKGDQVLTCANFNCPGQVVVSGHRDACTKLAELAEKNGAIKAIVLDVAGAFHSPLMEPAAKGLKEILDRTEFKKPNIPVMSNTDCKFHDNPDEIRQSLYEQVTSSTHWGQSMQKLLELGIDQFFEIGPKRTLAGFLKRIDRKAKCVNISSVADI